MDDIQLSSILVAMVRSAPVLIFAALGGLFAERSGIVDISLEGKILASAFTAAAVAYTTQNPWFGVMAAIVVSCVLALLHGYVCIHQRGNQLVSGMAINISVSGLTFVLAQAFYQLGGRTPALDKARFSVIELPGAQALADVPVLGWLLGKFIGGHTILVYLAFAMIPLVHWLINHSRFGLRAR
jgi:general nucleoside transport system permease protein